MQDYHKLTVWKKSLDLVKDIYQITTAFPKTEFYGLSNQIQRAAVLFHQILQKVVLVPQKMIIYVF